MGYIIIFGNTPLHEAIWKLELVKCLVEAGADVNAQSIHGHTPIMYAAFQQKFDVISYLIDHGADINLHFPDMSVFYELESPNTNIFQIMPLKRLIELGADINLLQWSWKITIVPTYVQIVANNFRSPYDTKGALNSKKHMISLIENGMV